MANIKKITVCAACKKGNCYAHVAHFLGIDNEMHKCECFLCNPEDDEDDDPEESL